MERAAEWINVIPMAYYEYLNMIAQNADLFLILGILLWALGWKIYKFFVALFGFTIFALVAYAGSRGDAPTTLITGASGAILAIVLMYVVVFLLGMFTGMFISLLMTGSLSQLPLHIIFGVLVGVIFVWLFKFVIVFITSFNGSFLMLVSFLILAHIIPEEPRFIGMLILLTIIGILFQYKVWGAPKIGREKVPAAAPALAAAGAAGGVPAADAAGSPLGGGAGPLAAPHVGDSPIPRSTGYVYRPEYLVVVEGLPEQEIRFRCPAEAATAEYEIGRHGGRWDRIALKSQSVATRHAILQFLPGVNLVINHAESARTRVNELEIPVNTAYVIRNGDAIQFGEVKCILRGSNP